ncbi:hypothetical protein EI94DRAFT_965828 [Lactarius quietus]|nr:hypothetical protein EI94DRAFT_965828 [Lactarius quietus]
MRAFRYIFRTVCTAIAPLPINSAHPAMKDDFHIPLRGRTSFTFHYRFLRTIICSRSEKLAARFLLSDGLFLVSGFLSGPAKKKRINSLYNQSLLLMD